MQINLNHVMVPSIDVATSVAFYSKLGLKQIVSNLPSYARFECPNGDGTLSVHQVVSLPEDPGVIVYFECEDLDNTVETLKVAGIRFESDPVDQSYLWREAYLRDPDGNKLCLYYAGKSRHNPPWRLKP